MIDIDRVGYNHLISNKCECNNCFIKNDQEILLDLVDFALKEQPGARFSKVPVTYRAR